VKGTMRLEKMGTVEDDKAEGGDKDVGDCGGATGQQRSRLLLRVSIFSLTNPHKILISTSTGNIGPKMLT